MTTQRRLAAALAAAALTLTVAACGGDGDDSGGGGKISLTVATFSDFGYEPLIKDYMAANPNIEVKIRKAEFDPHHKQLATRLAAGSGAADIEAVEEGYLPQFRQSADKFQNLADYGANDVKSQWLPWKWEQGLAGNGQVMGLGTDMGGLAMCYRTDLMAAAGMPTDPAELSEKWKTWDAYFALGREYAAKGQKAKWFDGAGNIYSAMINQIPFGYFDPQTDAYVGDTNPQVKTAWDQVATASLVPGMSGQLDAFSQQWTVGFKQGTFATLPCPSWMLGLIKDGSGPENSGKWNIASVPGGGGNWGGSFLTIPKQGKHPQEAYALAKFLTSPENEIKIFQSVGSLPSQPGPLKDPAVLEFKNEYFNNAPVGEIFAKSGETLQPNYRGTKDGDVRPVFGRALVRVEQGKQEPAAAWQQALDEAKKALG